MPEQFPDTLAPAPQDYAGIQAENRPTFSRHYLPAIICGIGALSFAGIELFSPLNLPEVTSTDCLIISAVSITAGLASAYAKRNEPRR